MRLMDTGKLRRGERLVLAAVLCAASLLYIANLDDGLVSDDFGFAYYALHAGPADLWRSFVPHPAEGGLVYYRPLGLLLWKLGHLLGGTPLVQHGLSLALHLLNVALCYYLARRLVLSSVSATCAAAIFALFPTHGEAVIWVSARFDLLATALGLTAVLLALSRRPAGPWLAALSVALALMTKESAVVLPALIALAAGYASLQQAMGWSARLRRIILTSLPAALALGVYLAWRVSVVGWLGGAPPELVAPLPARLALVLSSLAGFLLAPLNWQLLREYWRGLAPGEMVVALLAAGGALAAVAGSPRGRPPRLPFVGPPLLGAAWVAVSVVPLLNASLGSLETFEGGRYVYLPAVGLAIGLASLLCEPALLLPGRTGYRRAQLPQLILLGVLLSLCAGAAVARAGAWGEAADDVDAVLAEIQRLYPHLPPQATIAHALPDSRNGVFQFRNGVEEALRLAYRDDTLRAANLGPLLAGDQTPVRPDRVSTVIYEGGTVRPLADMDMVLLRLAAQRTAPDIVGLSWERGVFDEERAGPLSWRWMGERGCLRLEAARTTSLRLAATLWSPGPARRVELRLDGLRLAVWTVTGAAQRVEIPERRLRAGTRQLCFVADGAARAGADDPRQISIAVSDLHLDGGALVDEPTPSAQPTTARFANGLELIASEVLRGPGPLQAEQQLTLVTFWRNPAPAGTLWRFAHLVDASGRIVAQADAPVPQTAQTARAWRDSATLQLPALLPDGAYQLQIGLYELETGRRVALHDSADGAPRVTLATLHARAQPPIQPWRLPAPAHQGQ